MKGSNLILIGCVGAVSILNSACTRSETSQPSAVASMGDGKGTAPASTLATKDNVALVRFVNATPSSKDLAFGDMTPFSNVGARAITEYKSLPAQRHDFKLITDSSTGKAMATSSEGLTAGKHYTVVAVTAKDGTFSLDAIADDLTPPSPGKAKIRVINLDPGASNVDLFVGGNKDALISGVGLDHPPDYKEVAPSEGALNIRNTMNKKNGEAVKDLQLEAGRLYTILVFGDQSGKLKIKTVQDVFTDTPAGS